MRLLDRVGLYAIIFTASASIPPLVSDGPMPVGYTKFVALVLLCISCFALGLVVRIKGAL